MGHIRRGGGCLLFYTPDLPDVQHTKHQDIDVNDQLLFLRSIVMQHQNNGSKKKATRVLTEVTAAELQLRNWIKQA